MTPLIRAGLLLLLATATPAALAQAGSGQPAAAPSGAAPADFGPAFARHLERGTLFDYYTAKEFIDRGWGTRYRDAIPARFPGLSLDGLSLEVDLDPGWTPAVGQTLELSFWISNNSDREASLPVRGSCGTVHGAEASAIDPEGQFRGQIGQGLVGGPHCFCSQVKETVPARSRVKLATTVAHQLKVSTWAPKKPGKHVIVGEYMLPGAPGAPVRRLFSKPLVVEVAAE